MILSYATNKVSIFLLKILPLLPSLNFKQFFHIFLFPFRVNICLKFSSLITLIKLYSCLLFLSLYAIIYCSKIFPPSLCLFTFQQCKQLVLFSYKQGPYSCLYCTLHVFQFQNSQYGTLNSFPPVHITNTTPKYRSTLFGLFMFSCSLTWNHRNHRLNHLLSALALLHTPWPLSGFSPGLSLWPISRRRSASICPALLVCDPVTKKGDFSYWQGWGKLRVWDVRKETEMTTWSEGRNEGTHEKYE